MNKLLSFFYINYTKNKNNISWEDIDKTNSKLTDISDVPNPTIANTFLEWNGSEYIWSQIAISGSNNADYVSTSNPTNKVNPSGVGAVWINSSTGEIFVCTDNSYNMNKWVGQLGTIIGPYTLDFFGDNSEKVLMPLDGDFSDLEGHSVSTYNSPIFVEGKKNKAVKFTGNQTIKVSGPIDCKSVSFWIYIDNSIPASYCVVMSGPNGHWNFLVHQDLKVSCGKTGICPGQSINIGLTANSWHHICLVWNGSNAVDVYLDGNYAGTSSIGSSASSEPRDYLLFGSGNATGGDFPCSNILIDHIRVFSRQLSASEVEQLYNELSNRIELQLNNPNSCNLSDFQIKINLSGVKSIIDSWPYFKVTTTDGTIVPFTYEKSNGEVTDIKTEWDTSSIWIKIPSISANSNIVLYIMPSSVETAVSGDDIFDFYDDFNNSTKFSVICGNGSLQNGKIQLEGISFYQSPILSLPNNVIIEAVISANTIGESAIFGLSTEETLGSSGNTDDILKNGYDWGWWGWNGSAHFMRTVVNSNYVNTDHNQYPGFYDAQTNVSYYIAGAYDGNILYHFKPTTDNSLEVDHSREDSTFKNQVWKRLIIGVWNPAVWNFHWIRVRKYAKQNLTYSIISS